MAEILSGNNLEKMTSPLPDLWIYVAASLTIDCLSIPLLNSNIDKGNRIFKLAKSTLICY